MLGKGVKRKLVQEDEEQDTLGGEALPLPGERAKMAASPCRASYSLQRQTVFDLSLRKLYTPAMPAEPRLARRVLITNMLYRIQDECRQEGGLGVLPLPTPNAAEVSRGASPPPPPSGAPALASPLDSCLTPASLLEEDSGHLLLTSQFSRPTPQLATPPKDSFSSALAEIEELCPTATATSTTTSSSAPSSSSSSSPEPPLPSSPPSGTDAKEHAETHGTQAERSGRASQHESRPAELRLADSSPSDSVLDTTSSLSSSFPSSSSSLYSSFSSSLSSSSSSSPGFFTDLALDDILFSDIDTSLYDFNPSSKTVSMVTDDLVMTLSTYSSGGGGSPALSQNQPFKMDLTELDHIMEVLVGS